MAVNEDAATTVDNEVCEVNVVFKGWLFVASLFVFVDESGAGR